jgi:hypothetical protein
LLSPAAPQETSASAHSGHSPAALRTGNINPLLTFPGGALFGGNAHMSGPSVANGQTEGAQRTGVGHRRVVSVTGGRNQLSAGLFYKVVQPTYGVR